MAEVKPLADDELPPPRLPKIKIEIELVAGQGVTVKAPFDDKLLCYGLLEIAKDEVRRYWARLEAQKTAADAAQAQHEAGAPGSHRTPAGLVIP